MSQLRGLVVLDRVRRDRPLGMNRGLRLAAPLLGQLGIQLQFVAARSGLHFLRTWSARPRLRYDFAIFNSLSSLSPNNPFGYRFWQVARGLGLPIFIYWHETAWAFSRHLRRFPDNADRLEQIGLNRGIVHLTVSQEGAAFVRRQFPVAKTRIVYECSAPKLAYDPARLPASPPLIVNIASVQRRKGVGLFVDTARQVCRQHPTARFLWLGDGATLANWRDQVRATQDGDRIHFNGYERDPHAYLADASLLFLSSRDDPFPLTVLEAMSLARRVVCFAVGGAPEALGDHVLPVPPFDTARAAEAILDVLRLPISARPAPALRSRYLAHFSPAAFAARFAAVLREELSGA